MTFLKKRRLQVVLLALSLMAVCGSANAADNIVEVADKAGTFKTLLAAAKAAGLVHALQEDGPLTVFAPTDDAFAKLPKHTLNDLLKPENKEKLATILKYHIIPEKLAAKDVARRTFDKTLLGDRISFSIRDGRLTVANANIIENDLEASNGIVHGVDEVLLPRQRDIVATAEFEGLKTFIAAAEAVGLTETLRAEGPITVLAPSDEAFAKLPEGTLDSLLKPENKNRLLAILRYHVLPRRLSSQQLGRVKSTRSIDDDVLAVTNSLILTINKSRVLTGNFGASNGVVHVIDSVLMPEPQNIIETAESAGTFKTLLAAAKASGLLDTLASKGPYTVFAPTDNAFAKLPKHTLNDLLKPENKDKLETVLKYHVIPRRLSFDEIANLPAIKTAQGAEVRVQVDAFAHPAGLAINQSNIISGDIDTSNGVIHVIDKVLLPPVESADNIVDVADKAGTFKTLLAAAKAAGLAHTLQQDGPFTIFAPTDDAFAKLPSHTLNDLLKPENKEKLATILKYHVISGKVTAKDAVKVESAKSLSGDSVSISIRDGRLAVNNANVIVNDVEASNGIIHVIDEVLLPPEKPVTYFEAGADVALLTRIDPTFESSLASKSGGKNVSISFCNLSTRSMLVYWIFPSGARRQWRGEIAPGMLDICERTFQNHVWLIADEHGKTLGLYIVGDQDAIIVNTQ